MLENPQGIGEVKYVALGDSLSAGVGSPTVNETFVYQYALDLSEAYGKVNLLNLAQPGGTTVHVMKTQVPQTVEENPDYITLLIGTNDIHNKRTIDDFRENYQYILNELLTKTDAQITVINIPYLGSDKVIYPPFNFLLNSRTKQFNEVISSLAGSIANNDRIRLIDLYTETYTLSKQSQSYYSSDLFHPSSEGYILWGERINAR